MAVILGSDRRTFVLPVAYSLTVGGVLAGVVALAVLVVQAPGGRSWLGVLIALAVAAVSGRFEKRYRDIDSLSGQAESLPADACRPPVLITAAWAIASLAAFAATAMVLIRISGGSVEVAGMFAGLGLASALRARKVRKFTERSGSVLLVEVTRPFRRARCFVGPGPTTV